MLPAMAPSEVRTSRPPAPACARAGMLNGMACMEPAFPHAGAVLLPVRTCMPHVLGPEAGRRMHAPPRTACARLHTWASPSS